MFTRGHDGIDTLVECQFRYGCRESCVCHDVLSDVEVALEVVRLLANPLGGVTHNDVLQHVPRADDGVGGVQHCLVRRTVQGELSEPFGRAEGADVLAICDGEPPVLGDFKVAVIDEALVEDDDAAGE